MTLRVKCIKCGAECPETSTGLCAPCRKVKCARPGCERLVLRRSDRTFCAEHTYGKRVRPDERRFLVEGV